MDAPHNTGNLRGARFSDADLTGARFVRCSLNGAVMRGVDLAGADLDAPWLLEEGGSLVVNGVDVAPFVDAELNRRFPGREQRKAGDPDGLRAAWAALQRTWSGTIARAEAMPSGTVDVQVDGEWSFSQTLRHLVMATDTWFRGAILQIEEPYHPIGQPNEEYAADGHDPAVFSLTDPDFADVLAVRADRVAMVTDYLEAVSTEELDAARANPWAPDYQETVLACLHTILEEEWEHHRYAVRDLDALAAARGSAGG